MARVFATMFQWPCVVGRQHVPLPPARTVVVDFGTVAILIGAPEPKEKPDG